MDDQWWNGIMSLIDLSSDDMMSWHLRKVRTDLSLYARQSACNLDRVADD